MEGLARLSLVACAGLLLGSCAAMPVPGPIGCTPAAQLPHPDVPEATLDVLTYNIEGLPWPARSGRAPQLRRIGEILKRLREKGAGPDVVLFQEAFSGGAVKAVTNAGYPALAAGPSRTQRSGLSSDISLPGRASARRGEIGLRFMSAGLVIASRYPVISVRSEPFSRASCAGFDCLANKGLLAVRIVMPGVPDPIFLMNTHMNAQRASRVSPERHLASHNAQATELSQFLAMGRNPAEPAIVGGDFNMRRAPARFDFLTGLESLSLVHQYCLEGTERCDIRLSWDGDAPWMDTQDLQFFASGTRVSVTPIRVEAMFDGHPDSPMLSDHDGFRVVYRLRWDRTARPSFQCPG